jgi:hypothetical protein
MPQPTEAPPGHGTPWLSAAEQSLYEIVAPLASLAAEGRLLQFILMLAATD